MQVGDHRFTRAVKLCPDLDSEHALTVKDALVEEPDSRDHVSILELACDDAEYKLVPDLLQKLKRGLEVNLELATVLVYGVFPLWLHILLEHTHAADSDRQVFHLNAG